MHNSGDEITHGGLLMNSEFDKINLYRIVQAMAQGYNFRLITSEELGDEYLVVDNPDYDPSTESENPRLVLDIEEFHWFCHS